MDVIQSEGLVHQQEIILKFKLARRRTAARLPENKSRPPLA